MNLGLVFSKSIILCLLVVLAIVIGCMLCFWGYKYFRIISLGAIGSVICFLGYLAAKILTGNLVIRLILAVSLSFFGFALAYFVNIIITFFLEKMKVRRAMGQKSYIVSAILGAALLAFAFYFGIYHSVIGAVLIGILCGGIGLTVQHKNKEKQVQFKTYDDLLKLQPLKEKEEAEEI